MNRSIAFRSAHLIITLWVTCLYQATAQHPNSHEQDIVIRHVSVITMKDDRVLPNQAVIIRKGIITTIGDERKVKMPRNAFEIDGTGKYLMPGLAEMHAHVPPGATSLEPVEETMFLYLANGITTIRGMLGHPNHLRVRRMINNDSLLGPRFITSGPSINGNSVKSPESGAEMVKKQKEAGYDFLKMHPGLTNEKYDAIARTAKEMSIAMAGHVSYDVGIWKSIETGYSTIDHLDGFVEGLVPGIKDVPAQQAGPFGINVAARADVSRIPELAAALKKHNVWVVPTESLIDRMFAPDEIPEAMGQEEDMRYVSRKTVDNWVTQKRKMMDDTASFNAGAVQQFIDLRRQLIRDCYRQGVGMLLGSDAPQTFNITGFAIHNELVSMVKAGLTPYEALKMGTVSPAVFMNQAGKFGTIEAGAAADLVLLSENPLPNIQATRKIEGVMARGKWLTREYLDQRLEKIRARHAGL